jgi:hypothetical protein
MCLQVLLLEAGVERQKYYRCFKRISEKGRRKYFESKFRRICLKRANGGLIPQAAISTIRRRRSGTE